LASGLDAVFAAGAFFFAAEGALAAPDTPDFVADEPIPHAFYREAATKESRKKCEPGSIETTLCHV